jgi:hypothetical protein
MRIVLTSIVIVLALVGAGFVLMVFHGSQLESEAPRYLSEALPAIAANWDPDELMKRGSPGFLKVTSEEKLREALKPFHALGAFVRYDGAIGNAGWNWTNGQSTATGSYVAKATFSNGQVTFTVKLSKHDDEWMIDFFQANYVLTKKTEPQGT